MAEERVEIPGSAAPQVAGARWEPVDPSQQISPTVVIRRPQGADDSGSVLMAGAVGLPREQAEMLTSADPGDLEAVCDFAEEHGLTVVEQNAPGRTIRLSGAAEQFSRAFGIKIEQRVEADGTRYLSYEGTLTVPASLAGVVIAVLGLDQHPLAKRAPVQ